MSTEKVMIKAELINYDGFAHICMRNYREFIIVCFSYVQYNIHINEKSQSTQVKEHEAYLGWICQCYATKGEILYGSNSNSSTFIGLMVIQQIEGRITNDTITDVEFVLCELQPHFTRNLADLSVVTGTAVNGIAQPCTTYTNLPSE
ncbi:hypothetical protein CBL_04623 [Carabus blaptoides fortunei]